MCPGNLGVSNGNILLLFDPNLTPWYSRVQGGDEQRDVQTMQKHPRLTVKKNDHASFERRSEREMNLEVEREEIEKIKKMRLP